MRILVSAYACEPGRGSEPGVGWNIAKNLADYVELIVITRKDVKEKIESKLLDCEFKQRLEFYYVDLPEFLLKFFINVDRLIYLHYMLWNVASTIRAFKISRKYTIDLVHNLTFVNNWLPPFVGLINKPFLWGPIGTHPYIPLKALKSFKAKMHNLLRNAILSFFRVLNPFLYLIIAKATKIIVINRDCRNQLPYRFFPDSKFVILPAIGVEESYTEEFLKRDYSRKVEEVRLLYVGAFGDFGRSIIKGMELLLYSFATLLEKFPGIRFKLIVLGDGPSMPYYQKLAQRLGILDYVDFVGFVSREKVKEYLLNSDIFFYPSFEGGGIALLEAMATGLPVVCLDFGGPGEFVTESSGIKVKLGSFKQMCEDLANAVAKLALDQNLRESLGKNAAKLVKEKYTWASKVNKIYKIYQSILTHEHPDYT